MIKIIAEPIFACRLRMRSRICAWMVTSRAVVGSSAMSNFGLQAIAIAIITRWRMPPESWWGYSDIRCSGEAIPTRRNNLNRSFSRLTKTNVAVKDYRLDELTRDREERVEARHGLLEHHTDLIATKSSAFPFR